MQIEEKFFSVGEAARAVGLTAETLRHYDRIGLVKPGRKDEWTKYRYYTSRDIVLLNTVKALQQMDLPLKKIKEVLAYDDLRKIIAFLEEAERRADEKIALLSRSREKIRIAKQDYENKLCGRQSLEQDMVRYFPQRVIMLSDTMEQPTLENLWNYLSHFYARIEPSRRERFSFEDLAGIYTADGTSRLFAVCTRYEETEGLQILPEGAYLCADCTEENRRNELRRLVETAKQQYGVSPKFTLEIIVVSGILHWEYQIQIYIGTL